MRHTLSLGALCGFLLVACSSAPLPRAPGIAASPLEALNPRPEGAPDVVILAVSGRCGVPCVGAPEPNHSYLERRGTLEAVAGAYRALGLKVRTYGYSAHLTAHYSRRSRRMEQGFLQMEARLHQVVADWVQGRSNPTRLVLLGHSHGTNWTHNLVRAYPEISFDTVIDLDGICYLWEDDNAGYFARYYAEQGGNPWRTDLARSCDVESVGRERYHVKDIAYPNVRTNLEVQSRRVIPGLGGEDVQAENVVFDRTYNVRLDGSRTGIFTFVSTLEGHNWLTLPGSIGMNWLTDRIQTLHQSATAPAELFGNR
ncbi:hypothetical protein HNR42_001018 [Deinobacterium chartae]|uniref:Uncharacterized protein n=1 Tax=Deinobacterium chartae TaxID=521158 RepID=A0A841HVR3_9DEIO|nr:hypothetical protein [Deinobacterium chartae]MBB6097601.1 hypothetical protein [Deinobacterium chartae]